MNRVQGYSIPSVCLQVIQDIGTLQTDGIPEISLSAPDATRNPQTKGEITDRYSAASESGSSTDGHPETADVKEVKKKGTSGLKLSNLMNLGRKKSSSMESPEKSLETSNYLNVLINSQWKSRYCCIKDGQLHFYQDRNRSKAAIQPVTLLGCDIIPQPTPDHLYSFRILHNGEELAMLEEEEPKTEARREPEDHTYLDLLPAKSFLHSTGKKCLDRNLTSSPVPEIAKMKEAEPEPAVCSDPEPPCLVREETEPSAEEMAPNLQVKVESTVTASPLLGKNKVEKGKLTNPVAIETKLGKNRTEAEAKRFMEVKEKLEKEREEIRVQLAQLRKERRELKESIANCSDKSILMSLEEKLKSKEEECKQRENQRVDLELQIVEVKENLRKAESGPFTLGTAVDPAHLDSSQSGKCNSPSHISDSSPVNSAMALKTRPLSIMTTGKGTVLQKAKEWEKKGAS
ncbi:actin filament-associated protein 1-like 2 [Pyxicephalus adspersus]|uniref:actin filament-associated protein 1-like 2 n=1 Tax=Pyxicephalus adspersus TaxID=30357 RepID=UPI003B59F6F5